MEKFWKVYYLCVCNSLINDSDKSNWLIGDLSPIVHHANNIGWDFGWFDLMNCYTTDPDVCLHTGYDYFRKCQYQMIS